nr:hypothetical protein [Chromobacterium sp. ASV5]
MLIAKLVLQAKEHNLLSINKSNIHSFLNVAGLAKTLERNEFWREVDAPMQRVIRLLFPIKKYSPGEQLHARRADAGSASRTTRRRNAASRILPVAPSRM